MSDRGRKHVREKRQTERTNVKIDATVELYADTLHGAVMDISAQGAFFRPDVGYVSGKLVSMYEPNTWLEPGDYVDLSISHEDPQVPTQAKVRWVGSHNGHSAYGLGLEFVDAFPMAKSHL